MLTALQWVASGGEQSLPEATAAEHLALTEGHVPEVIAGGDRNPKPLPSAGVSFCLYVSADMAEGDGLA